LYTEIGVDKPSQEEEMSIKRFVQVCLTVILLSASFVSVKPASAWGACPSTYYVQPGDWLAKIARNCGISLSSLIAANPWVNYTYYIYPGQVLYIPGGYEPVSYYCGPGYDGYGSFYIVCRGDTLGGIAMYYGVTVHQLQWRNGIPNPNYIYAGQVIYIY
jgi:LysM repeat protein